MFKQSKKIIQLAVSFSVLLMSNHVFAGFKEWTSGNATEQLSAGYQFLLLVAFLIGVIILITCVVLIALVIFEKAPPKVEQVGIPKLVLGSLIASVLMAIGGLFGAFTETTTGGDLDEETFQRLRGGQSSLHIKQMPTESLAIEYMVSMDRQSS